jgi:hypothetical protein
MMKKTGDQLAAQIKVHLLYLGRRANAAIVYYSGDIPFPAPIGTFEFWEDVPGEEDRVDVYFASPEHINDPKSFPTTPEGIIQATLWIQNEFETAAKEQRQQMLDDALGDIKGEGTRKFMEMFYGMAEGQFPGFTRREAQRKREERAEKELAENPEYVKIERMPRIVSHTPILRVVNQHPQGRKDLPTNAQRDVAEAMDHYRAFNAGHEEVDPTHTHALQELDDHCLAGWEIVGELPSADLPHKDAVLVGDLKQGGEVYYQYWAVPVEGLNSYTDKFVKIKNVESGQLVLEGPEPDPDQVMAATAIGVFATEFTRTVDGKALISLTVELVERYRSQVPAGWGYLSTECGGGGGRLIPARSIQIGEVRLDDGQLLRQLWLIPETNEEGT